MANQTAAVKLTLKITSFIMRLLLNIMFYILVVIVIVNVSKMAYTFTYQLYGPDAVDSVGHGTPIILQINKGESTMDISSKLELNGAIKNKYSFYLKTKLQAFVIMPGTYEISSEMTYNQILDIITDYSKSQTKEEDGNTSGTSSGTGKDSPSVTGSASDAETDSNKKTDTNTKTDTDTKTNTDTNTNTDTKH